MYRKKEMSMIVKKETVRGRNMKTRGLRLAQKVMGIVAAGVF